ASKQVSWGWSCVDANGIAMGSVAPVAEAPVETAVPAAEPATANETVANEAPAAATAKPEAE
ncbi:MAG: hypothetical protein HRU20_29150, partial [Pseudomonadales bacterium]|nr:hypothetical protein [Pseudomonadales bacterium]